MRWYNQMEGYSSREMDLRVARSCIESPNWKDAARRFMKYGSSEVVELFDRLMAAVSDDMTDDEVTQLGIAMELLIGMRNRSISLNESCQYATRSVDELVGMVEKRKRRKKSAKKKGRRR